MRGSGEPVPQLKFTVGSVRVSTGAVKSMLLKYSPLRPLPVPVPPPPVLALIFIQLKLACPPVLGLESITRRSTWVPALIWPRLLVMVRKDWNDPVLGTVIGPLTFTPSTS